MADKSDFPKEVAGEKTETVVIDAQMVQSLGFRLRDQFETNASFRWYKEQEWLRALRQHNKVYDPDIEKRQLKIAKDRGFAISEHALYIYADCTKPKCPYRK